MVSAGAPALAQVRFSTDAFGGAEANNMDGHDPIPTPAHWR